MTIYDIYAVHIIPTNEKKKYLITIISGDSNLINNNLIYNLSYINAIFWGFLTTLNIFA